jgi:methylenetetrahydrofolate reductase (NADPH)
MKIIDLYNQGKTIISFEIFPPKKDSDIITIYNTINDLKKLKPDFISVTFGAGGRLTGSPVTVEIARRINEMGMTSLAHITCSGLDSGIDNIIADLKLKGIKNILALRGDEVHEGGFRYAKNLIAALSEHGFCIGGAAYPEGHISCDNLNEDILHLKQKEDAGAEFFITQLFFDNVLFYGFLEKARKAGVKAPISAGIMPILSKVQISRMIFMCGASLPAPVIKMINKYGDEGESLLKAGLEYSLKQLQDLCDNGAQGIHIYTMNKPFIAEYCMKNLCVKRV